MTYTVQNNPLKPKRSSEELDSLLSDIALFFDVGKILFYEQLWWNDSENYYVETEDLSRVFKIIGKQTEESIGSEIEYIEKLKKENFSIIQWKKWLDNYYYKIPFSSSFAVCLTYVAWKHRSSSLENLSYLSRFLWKLHGMDCSWLRARHSRFDHGHLDRELKRIEIDYPEEFEKYSSVASALSIRDWKSFRHSVVHGDLHFNNCLFTDDDRFVVLDRDEVALAPCLLDLALSINYCCFPDKRLDRMFLRSFLSSYEHQRKLLCVEKESLLDAMKYTALVFSCRWLLSFGNSSEEKSKLFFRNYYWIKWYGQIDSIDDCF